MNLCTLLFSCCCCCCCCTSTENQSGVCTVTAKAALTSDSSPPPCFLTHFLTLFSGTSSQGWSATEECRPESDRQQQQQHKSTKQSFYFLTSSIGSEELVPVWLSNPPKIKGLFKSVCADFWQPVCCRCRKN